MAPRNLVLAILSPLIIYCVSQSSLALAQDQVAEESPYQGVQFRRWSPIVSNLDETIHLYTDILGLKLGSVTTDPKTSYVYEIFGIDSKITTRHAIFNAGATKRVLSVVEVPDAASQFMPQSPRMSAVLMNANGRFDEIVRQLKEEGYKTLSPHALGKNGIEIGFIDRDGHLYALYEFPYSGCDHNLLSLKK
jgi:catechol 2,3-dioxygenase-like lactoylglutathione lyase family enzyme